MFSDLGLNGESRHLSWRAVVWRKKYGGIGVLLKCRRTKEVPFSISSWPMPLLPGGCMVRWFERPPGQKWRTGAASIAMLVVASPKKRTRTAEAARVPGEGSVRGRPLADAGPPVVEPAQMFIRVLEPFEHPLRPQTLVRPEVKSVGHAEFFGDDLDQIQGMQGVIRQLSLVSKTSVFTVTPRERACSSMRLTFSDRILMGS